MSFLQNAWYAAGWSDDVKREPVGRTLLNNPVLLYRTADGEAVAIGNRCPHRFAPLSLGTIVDDGVECGYHGLRFGASGACVLNPHGDGRIAANMRVPAWPLVERHGLLWIWFGDPALADPAAIVPLDRLTDPNLGVVRGSMLVRANYELVVDNILDLSHTQFLHARFLKSDGFLQAKHDAREEDGAVFSDRKAIAIKGPQSFTRHMTEPDADVDVWMRARWDAPSICRLDTGAVATGEPEERGIRRMGVHVMTPETDVTTHYFFANVRNYGVADPAADAQAREWHRIGFWEQDKPMIEAVQSMMGEADFASLKPVLLSADAAALRARRVLRLLIERERAAPALAV